MLSTPDTMPLLEAPRNGGAANNGVLNGVSHSQNFGFDTEAHLDDPNRRQRIVVVGLGMVAISFL